MMKTANTFAILVCLMLSALLINACGGGSSGTDGTGSISMSVTDAKPWLPDHVTNVFVEFSEVWVHKSGGAWQQLALAQSPYIIDLLQFQNRLTTELVPPATLDAGKYTQVRIVVDSATLRFDSDPDLDEPATVPSGNLKTDVNFTIDLPGGSAVDIIIHFDLSKSIVATGNGDYQLKPVLHLFDDPFQAATISGTIDNLSFGDSGKATIIVRDSSDEEYTKVEVSKSTGEDPTSFSIFWLVPHQIYTVQIDLDQDGTMDCSEVTPVLNEGENILTGC